MKGLIIGRFQPFHSGHGEMIQWVTKNFKNKLEFLAVGIGSPNECGTGQNPFNYKTREMMVFQYLNQHIDNLFGIYPIPDFHNEKKWVKYIQDNIEFDVLFTNSPREKRIFEEAGLKVIDLELQRDNISATRVRKLMEEIKDIVPATTYHLLFHSEY